MADATLVAYRVAAAVARVVPATVVLPASQCLGWAASVLARDRRRQVELNLARVLGDRSSPVRGSGALRRTFGSYARYWIESFRLPGMAPATIDAGIELDGWDQVEAALARGGGVILALPHLGGWEWGGFWIATVRSHQITVVVEALEPPEVLDWFVRLRASLGMHVVVLGPGAASAVLRALKANHVVCLLSDRDLDGSGVEVDFFGERTTLPGGPVTLALRSGAPLLPAAVYFRGRDHHAVVRPPIATHRTGRLRDDVGRLTQHLAAELESLIRAAPEQWHLMQPNWPSDPGYREPAGAGGPARRSGTVGP